MTWIRNLGLMETSPGRRSLVEIAAEHRVMQSKDKWISVKELAAATGMTIRWVTNECMKKRLPARRHNKKTWRINRVEALKRCRSLIHAVECPPAIRRGPQL